MKLEITQPDDCHLHLRDGEAMANVVAASAAVFGRAVVMPNLRPPVVTAEDAVAYRDRILAALPAGSLFPGCTGFFNRPFFNATGHSDNKQADYDYADSFTLFHRIAFLRL